MIREVLTETEDRMTKSVDALEEDLKGIRTGRASPALVERLRVDYYGSPTNLIELASVSAPEPQLLTINPYDPGALKDIERAILQSDLGLTPSNDGKLIRLAIPPLTEERRKEIVKIVHKMCEERKVTIRNIRRDANEMLKELKKEGEIAEDDSFKGQENVQKITDEHIKQVDSAFKEKEKEILEF